MKKEKLVEKQGELVYQEIERQCEKELDLILVNLAKTFSKIEAFGKNLRQGLVSSGEEASKLLMESTGHWERLNIVCITLDTYKTKKELVFFNTKRMELEKAGEKVTATVLEREASDSVMDVRRVRNIVEAYRDNADKNIMSCQSLLKYLSDNYKRIEK